MIKVAVERRLRIDFTDEIMSRVYQAQMAEQEMDYQRGKAWAEQQKRQEAARKWVAEEAKNLLSAQPAAPTEPESDPAEQEAVTQSAFRTGLASSAPS